ncbi:MAG: hypothetical protein RLZZ244_3165 [Verrucomicrobiota bacterium]|jgi:DNA-binding transcriptional LysR family regulator
MPRPRIHPEEPPRRYFKELRFRQFRAFKEVARSLSFSEASETLHLSKPSLWQQVRALEEELETPLLRTENQHLSLTEDGALLLEMITPLVESFDSIRSLFLHKRGNLVRRLTVATTSTLLAHELHAPVQLYRKARPDVRVRFLEKPSRESLALLESGTADLAIIGLLESETLPTGCECDPWLSFPFYLVCPQTHPFATAKTPPSLAELADSPLILPSETTNARVRIDAVFSRALPSPPPTGVLESSTFTVLARYVEMEMGVALCSLSPKLAQQLRHGSPGQPPLAVRDVSSLFGEEPVVLVRRKGRHLLQHVEHFRTLTLKGIPA